MLRGSIEVAQRNRVAGWIFSSSTPLRDNLILAFVGLRCVGAGRIDRFRQDLSEAGLGDGYCGYDFPIVLHDDENLGAVVVRLQDSDAALIQTSARMIGPQDAAAGASLGAIGLTCAAWMQERGWLQQQEYQFLKSLRSIGAVERCLRLPRGAGGEAAPCLAPQTVAADLLALSVLGEVDMRRTEMRDFFELAGDASPLRRCTAGVAALWSAEPVSISVAECSHYEASSAGARLLSSPPAGGIEYSFGHDRLLFIHKDIAFAPLGEAPAAGMTLFTADARSSGNSAAWTSPNRAA